MTARPAPMTAGAHVALVAPAGPLGEGAVERAIERVRALGWVPRLGEHARGRHGYLAAPDEARLHDLNQAIRSAEVDAIWCLRGGYGTMRILDGIDWGALAARPRPLIGFSDNTALHLAARRVGVVSYHAPHPAAAEVSEFSLALLHRTLTGTSSAGPLPLPGGAPPPRALLRGTAEGPLVGGNLALLAALAGTPYALRAQGAIVFMEEVGEPAYRVDRLLSQLRLSGALDGVAGVAIGAFSEAPDADRRDLPTAHEVVLDRLGDLGVPILAGLPVGHVPDNWTLPVGVRARLDADAGTLELLEPAVDWK